MTRLLAEYRTEHDLLQAVRTLRGLGYRSLEVYSPYPVHGLDELLGRGPSALPKLVFLAGVSAAAAAYALEWLLNAYLYPLNVGARPPHFPLSFVPITFEMGILGAGLCAFLLTLGLSGLPELSHPVFDADGFSSATNDAFWLEISSRDARYEHEHTERELTTTGAARVVRVGDSP